jgi:hypothetical protein
MGNFEEGVRALERQRALRAVDAPRGLAGALDSHVLAGAPYKPGDRVLDRVTGEEGHVVSVQYAHVLIPAP